MTRTTLMVAGMSCDACVDAVRAALEFPGVQAVEVSLQTGVVGVDHDRSISVDAIVAAVQDTGYEVPEARFE